MHVNSITKRERDGYYLYSDGGIKLGGPFASSYEADSLGEYLSSTLGEAPVEEYQRMGSQHGYIEPQTTTFEGTPNPWGDLPTERKQADFRRETRGIPSGGFDWRNIIPNTLSDIRSGYEGLQGLFEREEDSLLDYNPEAELQEALQRESLEEQYLRDPTRYRGPEPPEDRGWTSRLSPVSTAQAHMALPMESAYQNVMQPMGRASPQSRVFPQAGLLDQQFGMGLDFPDRSKHGLKPTTEGGADLVQVGNYNLSGTTRTALEGDKIGELPWYQDRAYLAFDAASDFNAFNDAFRAAFQKDIPIESAYRDARHNTALKAQGSVSGSLHLKGEAFDPQFSVLTPEERQWLKDNAPTYNWLWHLYKAPKGHFKYTG